MEKEKENGEEALQLLSNIYYKVLRVDLTRDIYEEIKIGDEDASVTEENSSKISEWLNAAAESGQIHMDDREKYLNFVELDHLRQAFRAGETYLCCHYRCRVENEFRWVSMELVPSRAYACDSQVILLYIKDIHDQYAQDLEEHDVLTGGINRRGFLHQVQEILKHAEADSQFDILFFNIVGFKAVNELFGTDGGDDALRFMYQHLKNSALSPLAIARMEGDHFFCLVKRDKLNYQLLPDLCCRSFVRNDKNITLYAKCGIYPIDDLSLDVSMMCDCAKIAKSYIVDEYLKPYAVFDETMIENYLTGTEIHRNLTNAIDKGEFQVYYQPVCDMRTKRLVSAEALVRWIHPERGMISPGVFIPILEETGYVTRIDSYVLDSVQRFIKERMDKGLPVVPVSVNLSWMDFYDEDMMEIIKKCIRTNEKIRFEVTETSYAALSKREANVIEDLRKLGATILLDDFGSGYSSFSTICEYDFDMIKLDMEFVRRIGSDSKIKSIIHSIIDMSHHIGARVVAEGVETKKQLEFLGRHGCDYAQGYYFSRPLPQRDFEKLLTGLREENEMDFVEPEISITDLIDVNVLQKIQDSFSRMTGMAALTTNAKGVAVTRGSNFTEFCTRYTRQSALGRKRCEQCDRRGAQTALVNGCACAYVCHAGLVDYAAPIMANGKMVGCFIGGQILTEEPDLDRIRGIAKELGVPEEEYVKAVRDVNVVKKQEVDDAAEFLHTFANILSSVAYSKYKVNEGNKLLLQKNKQLDFMANHDSLTRLLNRSRMPEIYRRYREAGNVFSAILGDIDDFKMVNDVYGHDCGDKVLVLVSRLVDRIGSKAEGAVCRWGGEEILILLPMTLEAGKETAEQIRKEIEELDVQYDGKAVKVTMTLGVSCSQEADSMEQLVKLADERLYQGKLNGKNQVV